MYRLKMEMLTALAAWAITTVSLNVPVTRTLLGGNCPRDADFTQLAQNLSSTAQIYFPGSTEFDDVSSRWSVLDAPKVNVAILPGVESDVPKIVKFANDKALPFLAFNGAHGSITTLGKMDHGIEIYLSQLSSVEVSSDGTTATIGGGTLSKNVTDSLWAAGKQTVTGTCECVSLLGPSLGGGHGWLQGHHGLVSDQFVSMNIVLADGTMQTIDENSDLWWAVKGAGHNFGIVTSVTTKVYDIEAPNWAMETLIFSGDDVEAVYQAANDHLIADGQQPEDVINWSYWFNDPTIDAEKPAVAFYIIQEGVDVVDSAYTEPFKNIGPLITQNVNGTYRDLASWVGISTTDRPCQKLGLANPRFPIYLQQYNATAQRQIYDLFASATQGDSIFNGSLFMFEGYSMQGVQALSSDSTAFAYRADNLLIAPLLTYTPAGADREAEAYQLGSQLRQLLYEGSGRDERHVYVNYGYGDETPQEWYGSETWRQDRLQALKAKYDPQGKFSFYGPIA